MAVFRERVVRGRGRGGTVSLLREEESEDSPRKPESALYEPALNTINGKLVDEFNHDSQIAKITAYQGKTWTGGKWTRPGISVLAITSCKYPPRQEFEIVTFEVKPSDRIEVDGVFEALSHKQFAHRSYVLFHHPHAENSGGGYLEDIAEGARILDAARKCGVGVVVAGKADDWDTWNAAVEPDYHPPDPEQADLFVGACFEENDHRRLSEWFA